MVISSSSKGLAHFMNTQGYVDLGFPGRKFTWTNCCPGMANIENCIDIELLILPGVRLSRTLLSHIFYISPSDQIPIILNIARMKDFIPRPLKVKGFWTRSDFTGLGEKCLGYSRMDFI